MFIKLRGNSTLRTNNSQKKNRIFLNVYLRNWRKFCCGCICFFIIPCYLNNNYIIPSKKWWITGKFQLSVVIRYPIAIANILVLVLFRWISQKIARIANFLLLTVNAAPILLLWALLILYLVKQCRELIDYIWKLISTVHFDENQFNNKCKDFFYEIQSYILCLQFHDAIYWY